MCRFWLILQLLGISDVVYLQIAIYRNLVVHHASVLADPFWATFANCPATRVSGTTVPSLRMLSRILDLHPLYQGALHSPHC
ncbi:hypothetical protein BD769DRAFT_1507526 [Suillus cothurnatus]|nr:hypothetical protein BD769DRAFT_1507526 [Suillus cothurnatus]